MNPYLALAVLIFLAGTVFMLPLVPSLVELHRKSDAQPLNVIQQHAGEIRHFADSFRSYIKGLEPLLRESRDSEAAVFGTLPDGTDYLVLGRGDEALRLPLKEQDGLCPMLIATRSDLLLPSDIKFSRDIYAGGDFIGGKKNQYRAILGEKDVHLTTESRVTRWVHAIGEVQADPGCELYGRISSDRGIRLQKTCGFQRLNAPRIETGEAVQPDLPSSSVVRDTAVRGTVRRLLLDGNFEISPGEVFLGNLVVRGALRIGSGARVQGSVKGDKGVVLEAGVAVEGSLMSASKMEIGPNCDIHGPVIAEHNMIIESGTYCGAADQPTTVSAPWIEVQEGVVVFGTLWAREHGQVVGKA
ncbi:MAG: polymer-forming cytoskeletal protein [Terriglobales bacterium]